MCEELPFAIRLLRRVVRGTVTWDTGCSTTAGHVIRQPDG